MHGCCAVASDSRRTREHPLISRTVAEVLKPEDWNFLAICTFCETLVLKMWTRFWLLATDTKKEADRKQEL